MNQALSIELSFFLICVLSGGILLAVYDIFRILRRLINHNSGFIALEDLFFWVGASIYIFAMLFKENDGIIRGFAIMGMAAGMLLYHYTLSDLIVNLITKLIQTLISPLVFILNKGKRLMTSLWKVVKRVVNLFTRRLKKWVKSVRITVNKRKQATLDKRRKHLDVEKQRKQNRRNQKQKKQEQRNQKQKKAT